MPSPVSKLISNDTEPPPPQTADRLLQLKAFFQHGTQRDFTAFVSEHRHWLFSQAVRIMQDMDAAAEVVQDTFALLVKKQPHFSVEPQLLAWLHRSLLFLARNRMAKERVYQKNLHKLVTESVMAGKEDKVPEALLRKVDGVLDSLRNSDRELLLARFFRNQSWSVIGQALGLPPDTARKRSERLLEMLAGKLALRGVSVAGVAAAMQQSVNAATMGTAEAWAGAAIQKSGSLTKWLLWQQAVATASHKAMLGVAATVVAMSTAMARAWLPPPPPTAWSGVSAAVASNSATSLAASSTSKTTVPGRPQNKEEFNKSLDWGYQNPKAAVAWAQQHLSSLAKEVYLDSIASYLLTTDPKQALPAIQAMVPSSGKGSLGIRYVREIAKTDPQQALAFARTGLAGMAQHEAFHWVAVALLNKGGNLPLAVDLLAHTIRPGTEVLGLGWMTRFPPSLGGGHSGSGSMSGPASDVAAALEKAPPADLFAEVAKHPQAKRDAGHLLLPAFKAWATADYPQAKTWADAHSDMPGVKRALNQVLVSQHPTDAIATWAAMDDGKLKHDFGVFLATEIPKEHLGTLLATSAPISSFTTYQVLDRYAESANTEALAAALKYPLAEEHTRSLFEKFAHQAYAKTLNSLRATDNASGILRDAALAGTIAGISSQAPWADYLEGLRVLEALPDGPSRQATLRTLTNIQFKANASLRTPLEASDLTPSFKKQLLEYEH